MPVTGSGDYDLVIRHATVVTEDGVRRADIAVRQGRIAAVGEEIAPGAVSEEIDATGLHIFPGLIDAHVHCNEPGRTEWEGFETGTHSLAAGGVTTFFEMPLNSSPPTTTVAAFEAKRAAAEASCRIDYGLWGGLVPGNLDQVAALHECGVIGFKAFMSNSGIEDFAHVDDATLLEGMEEIATLDSILALHAESETITRRLTERARAQGKNTARAYTATRPILSEIEAIDRAAAYAGITGCRLHIVHVSSGQVAERADAWRRQGIDLTVETCPHYLALTEEDLDRLQGLAKCAPPLRSQADVESLWQCLADGVIDTVGSDHSPARPEMKQAGDIFEAWGGISGAQTTLNVLLEEGHVRRGLPLERIVRVTSANPARRFGLYPRKGAIAVGSDADLCLVDLAAEFRLEADDLHYRHRHSPFVGRSFHSKVARTLLRGQSVFPDTGDTAGGEDVVARSPHPQPHAGSGESGR